MEFKFLPRELQIELYESFKNSKDEDFEPFFEIFLNPEQEQRVLAARGNEDYAMIFHDLEAPVIVEENGVKRIDRSNGRRVYSSMRPYRMATYNLEKLERDFHLYKVIVAPASLWLAEQITTVENLLDYKDELSHEIYFENTGERLPKAGKSEHFEESLEYMKSVIDAGA